MLKNDKKRKRKTFFVTGAAGFIGSNLVISLLKSRSPIHVIGIDNMNDYYDVSLKTYRLSMIEKMVTEYPESKWTFITENIANSVIIEEVFTAYKPAVVINLAAQAGVRYSITNPDVYIESNIIGFYNILQACRNHPVEHLVYASSSSVYGANKKVPYSTADKVDNPISLYAATKKSDELLAHAYSKLFDIPSTGLRFFTVYGPAGRPDMAYFKFTNNMVRGEKIKIFNFGDMYRDFTYIDDVVQGIMSVLRKIPQKNEEGVYYKVYNIGNNKPVNLLYFVEVLENSLMKHGVITKPAVKEFLPMQKGDVYQTYADIADFEKDFDFKPSTLVEDGLDRFAKWYKEYYHQI